MYWLMRTVTHFYCSIATRSTKELHSRPQRLSARAKTDFYWLSSKFPRFPFRAVPLLISIHRYIICSKPMLNIKLVSKATPLLPLFRERSSVMNLRWTNAQINQNSLNLENFSKKNLLNCLRNLSRTFFEICLVMSKSQTDMMNCFKRRINLVYPQG